MEADQVIEALQKQMVVDNFQAMIRSISPKCFNLCVAKPGLKLSSSEEDCMERCLKTYVTAVQISSNAYMKRINQEQQNQG
jgi:mitochondrial import inner membrane translocase subunit TIM13